MLDPHVFFFNFSSKNAEPDWLIIEILMLFSEKTSFEGGDKSS